MSEKEVKTYIACVVGSSTARAGNNKIPESASLGARLARENTGHGKTCERKDCGREGELHFDSKLSRWRYLLDEG